MRRAAWIAPLLALGALAPASRGESLDEELQLWLQASVSFVLPAGPIKLVPYLEVQPRFDDDLKALDEVQHRVAFLVQPVQGLSIGAGFMYAAVFHDDPTKDDDEFRPYQEVRYQRQVLGGRLRLDARVRLEQRLFEGDDEASLRLRVRLGIEVPFAELAGGPVSFQLWEEPFVNLNDTPREPEGFDQNRTYVGISWQLAPGIAMETGYMAQLSRVKGGPDELGHTIWAAVSFTFR